MGHQAREVRHEDGRESSEVSGSGLEDQEVLDLLELPNAHDEVFDPARGIVYGILFGAALWALIILAYLLAS